MRLLLRKLVILTVSLFPLASHALDGITDQRIAELSQDPYWLKLLHYRKQAPHKYQSTVISDNFFRSTDGRTNPLSELAANIEAMTLDINDNPNLHAQCKFPERFHWLKTRLPQIENHTPNITCTAYEEWKAGKLANSVSVIFATGYLSNPASFYGHVLVKFDGLDSENFSHTDLLNTSVNYGAILPGKENPFLYIVKGLFGGYEAGFTQGPYYEHTHNYSNVELRDVWEYQLNLDANEASQLLRHSWELLESKFIYYYLHENCAYQLAELLSIVLEKPIHNETGHWTVPISIFETIADYEHRGKPLLAKTTRHASRQNQFYNKYYQLDSDQVKAIKQLSQMPVDFSHYKYTRLSGEQKIAVIDTLFDYYELASLSSFSSELSEAKRQALLEMLTLSTSNSLTPWRFDHRAEPHTGSPPEMIRIGGIVKEGQQDSVLLNWRPAYFDMLTIEAGTLPYSKLTMMDFQLELYDEQIKFRRLDIIDIDTLSLPYTGLQGDSRNSWALNGGIDRSDNACSGCSVGFIRGEWGKAREISPGVAFYSRLFTRGQTEDKTTSRLESGAHIGGVVKMTDWWSVKLDYDHVWQVDSDENSRGRTTIEQRFSSSRDWDIRVKYRDDAISEYSISFAFFY